MAPERAPSFFAYTMTFLIVVAACTAAILREYGCVIRVLMRRESNYGSLQGDKCGNKKGELGPLKNDKAVVLSLCGGNPYKMNWFAGCYLK